MKDFVMTISVLFLFFGFFVPLMSPIFVKELGEVFCTIWSIGCLVAMTTICSAQKREIIKEREQQEWIKSNFKK